MRKIEKKVQQVNSWEIYANGCLKIRNKPKKFPPTSKIINQVECV